MLTNHDEICLTTASTFSKELTDKNVYVNS